jgi:hypothetical protein
MWSKEELAWMAGIYEGEGSVFLPRSKIESGKFSSALRIRISMCDKDVLEQYGLSAQMICHINKGKAWKCVYI